MASEAWQIGSLKPPTICLSCGSPFDEDKHKIRGPYETGPYRYVCQWCWKKPYMFFSDKVKAVEDSAGTSGLERVLVKAPVVELDVTKGHRVNAALVTLPVHLLRLNPRNPRMMVRKGDLTQTEIEEWLWNDGGTRSLYNEILYSGGLSEKPIIDSTLTVLEGNRRIVCLRRLDDQAKSDELSGFNENAFEKVQCLMLPADVSSKDVELLLARVHVSGKKEWSPLSQAEQIYEMINSHGMSIKEVAVALSLSPHKVEVSLEAFRATLQYGELFPDAMGRWIHKFSYFYELFRNRHLREWARNPDNPRLFCELLSGEHPKLYLGSQVRELPWIIRDQEAFALLTQAGFDPAIEMVRQKRTGTEEFTEALIEASKTLRKISKSPDGLLANPEGIRVLGEIRKKTDIILTMNKTRE